MTIRGFVAAFPSQMDRAAIRERAEPLIAALPHFRAVTAENYHVTLRFLGNIGDEDVPIVRRALEPIAAASRSIRCRSIGVRALPSARRARVIAFELHSDGLLDSIGDEVHRALTARFGRADRNFLPHLTVLRSKSAARCIPPDVSNVELSLESIGLYRSDTDSRGARYSPLFELALGG
jgi:RNA 2',3'-cyclic 3'-phosphodiesterase